MYADSCNEGESDCEIYKKKKKGKKNKKKRKKKKSGGDR